MNRLRIIVALTVAGICGLLGAVALALVPAAAASRSTPQPLVVQSTSVVQDGASIQWQVQLAQPFSPGALTRGRRALCLLIDGVRAAVPTREVCVAGPAKGSRAPRLYYMNVIGATAGPAQHVPATVTRGSDRELTASFLPSAVGLAYSPFHWQVISTIRAAACAARSPVRATCFKLYPPKPALLDLHAPGPVGCVPSGPSLVYHGPSKRREIALTFDDGPWSDPPTIDFLHVLEQAHVPATFFEIGRQLAGYDPGGTVAKRMLLDGDMIGDHTWSHPNMAATAPAAQRVQLLDTLTAIHRSTGGFTPCLWRPPYGAVSPSLVKLARSLGLLTIMWNVDPRDWSMPGVDAIYANVVSNAAPGAIVLQHFGGGPRGQTLAALPKEIATLRRRGYRFVTVAEMLGLKLLYR
jgi:peptidoglycan/xylan/chitin deacetylase (PgdA/CDA1 family)